MAQEIQRKRHTDRLRGSVLEVVDHAIEIEANGVLVVVLVLLDLEAGVLEDGGVVSPGRGRQINGLRLWIPSLEKGSTNAKGACTGDGLGDGEAALLERSRVRAISKDGGTLCAV